VTKAAHRAAALTHQLLAFGRKQILAPRVLHLGDIVSQITPMLRRLLGETIDLKTTIGDRGRVMADAGQIEQVIVNLAVNARDAMRDGGRLTLETVDVVLDDAYARHHPGVRPGRYVMVAVSDTGHGMDAATQKRIFEPFFTTKPKGQGTGLGLATAYGIARQSGGHISVYSEPGRGATFKVYLPQSEQVEEYAPASPTAARALRGSETILLVEDEEFVREFVHRALSRYGYTVHAVEDASKALEFGRAHAGGIDLILTDVVLPDMSGRIMAGELQQRHAESKVLFMSGYTDDAIVHHGVLDAEMWFLQKPFTADAIAAKVRDVLDAPRGPSHAN
jgi:two-component system, cell cycle sensor histidine kinase and response regulator CckA